MSSARKVTVGADELAALAAGSDQGDAAEHLVGPPRERRSRAAPSAASAGLPSSAPSRTTSVSTPRTSALGAPSTAARGLAERVLDDELRRVALGQLVDAGGDDLELEAEQRRAALAAAARRRRGSASVLRCGSAELREPDADLALGRLVGVGAVDEVEGHLGAEVAADRAGLGLDRVGRADQLARGLDGLDALEDRGDERAAGDEVDELAEERLARCARRSARAPSPPRRCSCFRAVSRRPLRSKRARTSPVRPRSKASGLIRIRVRVVSDMGWTSRVSGLVWTGGGSGGRGRTPAWAGIAVVPGRRRPGGARRAGAARCAWSGRLRRRRGR